MKRRQKSALPIVIAICILILLWPLEGMIEAEINSLRPQRTEVQLGGDLPGIYRFFQLAGLNALLADILWMKADDLWHSSSWWEMAPVMEAIVRIDPKFTMVWEVLAWHYGWNLHAASKTQVDRAHWLDMAADAYRRATQQNPEHTKLWWDMCWFYLDRTRQFERAVDALEEGRKRFPEEINTIDRSLQRVYEKTWRIEDAIGVIEDINKKDPKDALAQRDLEWWTRIGEDENWRWVLEVREHMFREKRNLPVFRNPFEGEGKEVSSPPWRDWGAPYYMDPEWKPDLSKFEYSSVMSILPFRSDVAADYYSLHPEYSPAEHLKGTTPSTMPRIPGLPQMGPMPQNSH